MRLKKSKDFFKNFNKSPLQIGEELYDSLKDDLRVQFLTISDRTDPRVADVQYVIQNGKVRIKILYVGNNQPEIEEISTDIKYAINRLKKLSKHPIDGPSYSRIDNQIDQLGILILETRLVKSTQTRSIFLGRVFTRILLRKYP